MEPDILGNGFQQMTLPLRDDNEGKVVATLVRKKGKKSSKKAVLYVHGFVDYFFQEEMAENYIKNGFHFYALDLRKYGRSLLPHQTANFFQDINEYFEELDKAIDIIRKDDGVEQLLLSGHSTGGLVTSLYANLFHHENKINALFLNSPFFEFNENWINREVLMGLVGAVGKAYPYLEIPGGLSDLYGKSLHKDHKGEWDYNLDWRPLKGFSLRAGWLRGIDKAHKKLQSGLKINCPVLVMYSTQSVKVKNWDDKLLEADAVLDVSDIDRYSDVLGDHVTEIRITGGMHDLILSSKPVRDDVYQKLFTWLTAYFPKKKG